jgi:hypothetical protein
MSKRARKSTAIVALLSDVAPASGTRGAGSFTASEDRVLATDKAKQEATAALGVAGEALRAAQAIDSRVSSATSRFLVRARQEALDAATVAFDAAWDAAFEALEAHDANGEVSAA